MRRSLYCRSVFWAALLCGAAAMPSGAASQSAAPGQIGERAQAAPWKSYSYPADGFEVSYPAEPALQKKSVDTAAGPFELHSYVTQTSDAVLFVGVCDYGTGAPKTSAAQKLEGAKNGALLNSGSRLVSEKKISLGGSPGIEFDADSMAAHFTARLYMVDTRLYQVLVIYPLAKPYAQAAQFLDSFKLIALSPAAAAGKPEPPAGK